MSSQTSPVKRQAAAIYLTPPKMEALQGSLDKIQEAIFTDRQNHSFAFPLSSDDSSTQNFKRHYFQKIQSMMPLFVVLQEPEVQGTASNFTLTDTSTFLSRLSSQHQSKETQQPAILSAFKIYKSTKRTFQFKEICDHKDFRANNDHCLKWILASDLHLIPQERGKYQMYMSNYYEAQAKKVLLDIHLVPGENSNPDLRLDLLQKYRTKALFWLKKAMENQHLEAHLLSACLYHKGNPILGVKPDPYKALKYLSNVQKLEPSGQLLEICNRLQKELVTELYQLESQDLAPELPPVKSTG